VLPGAHQVAEESSRLNIMLPNSFTDPTKGQIEEDQVGFHAPGKNKSGLTLQTKKGITSETPHNKISTTLVATRATTTKQSQSMKPPMRPLSSKFGANNNTVSRTKQHQ